MVIMPISQCLVSCCDMGVCVSRDSCRKLGHLSDALFKVSSLWSRARCGSRTTDLQRMMDQAGGIIHELRSGQSGVNLASPRVISVWVVDRDLFLEKREFSLRILGK